MRQVHTRSSIEHAEAPRPDTHSRSCSSRRSSARDHGHQQVDMLPYPHVHGALLQVDVPEHAHAEGVDDQVGVPLNSRRCTGRHRSPSRGSSEFVVHVLFIVKVLFIVQNKREEQEKNTNTNTNATSRPLAAPTQARPRERARPSVPPDDPARPTTYVRTPRPDPTRPAPTRLTD